MLSTSLGEIGFVVLLFSLILSAPLAPKLGEAIGGLFDKRPPPSPPA